MENVIGVFAADTHLSQNTWTSRSQIVGDSIFGFRQLCDIAIQNGCPLVIAGDCWELARQPRPDAETVKFVRDCMDDLKRAGCEFYFINGQHDNLSQPYWFNAIHEWPQHLGGRTVRLGNFTFHGVDYFEHQAIEQVVASLPTDLSGLVVHQSWQEFTGARLFSPLSLDSLPDTIPIVISGDTHLCMTDLRTGQYRVSLGSTHQRTLTEPTEHFCMLLHQDGQVKFEKLKSRQVFDFNITDAIRWASELHHLVASVEQSRQYCLDSGYPDSVAEPLVRVNDSLWLGIEQTLRDEMPSAHVIVRDMSVRQTDDSLNSGTDMLSGLSGNQLALSLIDGMELSDPQKHLLAAVVTGKDILKHLGVT
jgi:hypothetical protein